MQSEFAKEILKSCLNSYRYRTDRRFRQLPTFRCTNKGTHDPRVFYYSPSSSSASGGIRNIYRHVDALNAMGIEARVLHTRRDYRAGWFNNSTLVCYTYDTVISRNDVLVIPEYFAPSLASVPEYIGLVVFNQAGHYTFDAVDFDQTEAGSPYMNLSNLLGILTVSEDSAALLKFAFPALTIQVARPVIDSALFRCEAGMRQRQISYVTHRREQERLSLLHMLRARGVLDRWQLMPIVGRSESETARIMRRAPISSVLAIEMALACRPPRLCPVDA